MRGNSNSNRSPLVSRTDIDWVSHEDSRLDDATDVIRTATRRWTKRGALLEKLVASRGLMDT
jgi:hypothetical protein